MNNTKKCTKCQEQKTTEDFYRNSRTTDGLHSYCKTCTKNYNQNKYKQNTEQIKQKNLKWQKNNPEKVKIYKKKYEKTNRRN